MHAQTPIDALPICRAAELLGVSRFALNRLIVDRGLPVYTIGFDRRLRLVRIEDVESLLQPQRKEAVTPPTAA